MRFPKQSHKLGGWWGNIQLTSQHSNTFIQMFILAFSGTAAYGVIAGAFADWGYYLPFWQFVLGVVLVILLLLSLVWTFGMPSIFISWNRQWWDHQNPYRKDYEDFKSKVLSELEDIKAHLSPIGKTSSRKPLILRSRNLPTIEKRRK